jgi:hypothetical protein
MNIDKNVNVSIGLIKGIEFTFYHDGNIIKLIQSFTGKDRVTVNGQNILEKRSFKINDCYSFDIQDKKYEIALEPKFGKGINCSFKKDGALIKKYIFKYHYKLKTYLIVLSLCLLVGIFASLVLPSSMLLWPQILLLFLVVLIIVVSIFYIAMAITGEGFIFEEIEVE